MSSKDNESNKRTPPVQDLLLGLVLVLFFIFLSA